MHAPSAAWEVPDRQRPNIHVAQLSEGVCAKGKAPHTKRRVVCSRRKGERARRRSMCEHVVIANSDEIDRQRPFCALSRPIPLIAHVHKKGLACHPLFRGLAQTPKNCFVQNVNNPSNRPQHQNRGGPASSSCRISSPHRTPPCARRVAWAPAQQVHPLQRLLQLLLVGLLWQLASSNAAWLALLGPPTLHQAPRRPLRMCIQP